MPRPSIIERHPDKKAIVDSIMANIPQSQIAKRFGIGQMAVSRFKTNVLRKALDHVQASRIKDASSSTIQHIRDTRGEIQEAIALQSTSSIVERKLARYDRILDKAEASGDLSSWAAVDGRETATLRLRAELSGEIAAPSVANIQMVVLLPAEGEAQPEAESPTIDTTAEPA